MNEEIYEGTPAKEDMLIGTDSGYNRYRRPDGSTYVHYPYSQMATVTAYSAKDKNGQPIRTADGKLITGKTQAEADRNRFRYDMNHWVEANRRKTAHLPEGWRERIVTPDMNTFNAITGGVFNLTPIQVGRGVYNLSQGKDPGFILGNSGVVSKEYAQEHPWLALGANVLGEGLVGGFIYGTPKLYNAGVKNIRNYRMARAFDRAVQESNPQTILNHTFPGQIGQGPKQTFTGYHASFEENLIPDYWFKGWSQKKHGAPNGFYTAAGDGPISGFLTERPYVHHFESTFDKPMVQIGEVPTPLKNATRNQIEEFAKSQGSDGIIYYGIADNKMRNQTIAKTLHPDVIVSNVSYTDKKPFKQIFNTDKTGAIVFRGGKLIKKQIKYEK